MNRQLIALLIFFLTSSLSTQQTKFVQKKVVEATEETNGKSLHSLLGGTNIYYEEYKK